MDNIKIYKEAPNRRILIMTDGRIGFQGTTRVMQLGGKLDKKVFGLYGKESWIYVREATESEIKLWKESLW